VLRRDPFSGPNIRRLHVEFDGLFRLRVDPYRVIYEIDGRVRVVIIIAVGTRGSVY
jgi:mRNA interferase RelE/StbE